MRISSATKRGRRGRWLAIGFAALALLAADGALAERTYPLRVEGRPLAEPAVEREGVLLLPLPPIARELGARVEKNRSPPSVQVVRAPDGLRLRLDLETGIVSIGERSIGQAPRMDLADAAQLLLPEAAVEALTGTETTLERGVVNVDLDRRLRSVVGFEVEVEGRVVPFLDPLPRSIGSVLLLPLRGIADALDDPVELDESAGVVRVLRSQDGVEMSLNLLTGVVRVRGQPVGVVPDFTYADRRTLLLPAAAVEALTGTRVTVVPGERKLEIDLDDRLRDILGPQSGYLDEARKSPLVFENLRFRVGNDIANEFTLDSRFREFQLRLGYETPDLIEPRFLQPRRLQLAFESLEGYSGTLGTYRTLYGELDALRTSRVLGLSLQHPTPSGKALAVLGQPQKGSRFLDNDRSVPRYDGWTVAGRFLPDSREWEAGVSALVDDSGDDRAAVGSYERRFSAELPLAGFTRHLQELDVGWFDVEAPDSGVDWRGRWDVRFAPAERVAMSAQIDYRGANFNRSLLVEDEDLVAETSDTLRLAWTAGWEATDRVTFSSRYAFGRDGLFAGDSALEATRHTAGIGVSLRPFDAGPHVWIDYARSLSDDAVDGRSSSGRLYASLSQSIGGLQLRLAHEREHGDLDRKLTTLTAVHPFAYPLPGGASLQLAPRLSAARFEGDTSLDVGGSAILESGRWLGSRLRFRVQYTQIHRLETLDEYTGDDADRFLVAGATLDLDRNLQLGVTYRKAFGADHQLLTVLRGDYGFAPRRRLRRPRPGAGVLTGSVFLDRNRDGIRDADEKGLGSVPVRLMRTGLMVRTSRMGEFTVQNLRSGAYDLSVSLADLPLGMIIPPDTVPRVRVEDGEVTRVDVPVIESAQIYGRLFEDLNANDLFDPGERGIEGVRLWIRPGDVETFTTAFGQFSVEGLAPGEYEVEIDRSFMNPDVTPPIRITVGLPVWARTTDRIEIPMPPGGSH